MSMGSIFVAIAELNARAVGLLQHEDNRQAIRVFHETLAYAQNCARHLEDDRPRGSRGSSHQVEPSTSVPRNEPAGQDNENRMDGCQVLLYSVPLPEISSDAARSSDANEPVNLFSMHNRAIKAICPRQGPSPGPWPHALEIHGVLLATLMYNAGVLYHRHGLRSTQSRTLNKGLELYELALAILYVQSDLGSHDDRNGRRNSGVDKDLLLMALYNNAGHLLWRSSQLGQAILYRNGLRRMIAVVSRPNYVGSVGADDLALFRESAFGYPAMFANQKPRNHPASAA